MAPAFGAVITTPERRALRASASGEQHRMSARIEAERPRPLGLGSREPVRLAGRALKTVFTAFNTGTLSDRNKRDIKHRRRQAWPLCAFDSTR